MKINALLMNEADNVVTCVTEVPAGAEVLFRKGNKICHLTAKENIPFCHKIALTDLKKGDHVRKYGESLGITTADIPKGHWVSHHNLISIPRDYNSEMVPVSTKEIDNKNIPSPGPAPTGMTFWGYRRSEGRPGIRNHVLILPTCACASETCRLVANQVKDAVNIVFNTGCSDVAANTEMSQRILTGFARNPNVYGVVIIGLGCETVPHEKLKAKLQALTKKPIVSFGIQEEGGTVKTTAKAVAAASQMAREAAKQPREEFPISELLLGIECGGSDATSGIAANPAVGELSDLLIDQGGSSIMSESIEWIGGEHLLAKRAATPAIHNAIIKVCQDYEVHLKAAGQDCRAGQPTPGNKTGGLSTLDEKSLGCIKKGGTRPIVEVLPQAVPPTHYGAMVMDTAGYDIASVTSMVAGGCQAVIFTTGRGTVTGNAIAPVFKVTANEHTYTHMEDNMDFDLSPIIRGEKTYQAMGKELLHKIKAICDGEMTKAESFGFSDIAVDHICRFV